MNKNTSFSPFYLVKKIMVHAWIRTLTRSLMGQSLRSQPVRPLGYCHVMRKSDILCLYRSTGYNFTDK